MEREPLTLSRGEAAALALTIGSDDPYEALALPEPEPEPDPSEQTSLSDEEARDIFDILGWWWPW